MAQEPVKQKTVEIDKLPKFVLQEILNALASYFPKELGLDDSGHYATQTPVHIDSFGYDFANLTEFQNFVQRITNTQDLRSAYAVLYQTWESLPNEVQATVPQKEQLEKLKEEAAKSKEAGLEAKEKAKRDVERRIKELETAYQRARTAKEKEDLFKKIAEITREQQESLRAEAVPAVTEKAVIDGISLPKRIYLNIPQKINFPEISVEAEVKIKGLVEKTIKTSPAAYVERLTQTIIKKHKPPNVFGDKLKIFEANSRLVAVNYVDKLLGLEPKLDDVRSAVKISFIQNAIHVANSLSNPKNPIVGEKTAKAAQVTALTLDHDHSIARKLLTGVADEKLLEAFYPTSKEVVVFEVAEHPDDSSAIAVDKEIFTERGLKLEESNNQIFNYVKENAWETIKEKSWQVLDRTFSNTPWYPKTKDFISRFIPDFLKPVIPVFPAEIVPQPELAVLWGQQGIQLLTTDLPTLLSSTYESAVLLTPAFNLEIGSFAVSRTIFTTAEGLTGQALGINIGDFGVTLIQGGEKGTQILINFGIKAGAPTVSEAIASAGAKVVGTVAEELATTTATTAAASTIPPAATGAAAATGAVTATTAATGTAATGLAGILATLGAWGTPILMAIGAAIGWIAGKVLGGVVKWLKKHKEDVKIFGAVVLGAGVFVQSIPLMIIGTVVVVPTFIAVGGLAGVGTRILLFGRAIGKSAVITISTPVLVAIVVFPIIVAFTLFIINSGAYLVPPSLTGFNFESPYIGVTKTANPPGPFQNTELPLEIEYTVTVTAKKGVLTNIRFSDDCQVIKKGSPVDCPNVSGSLPSPPAEISPTSPFTFSYSVKYAAGKFEDSLVVNNFTVTADTPETKDAKGVGSASIKIGDPPEECPNSAWPIEAQGGLYDITQGPLSGYDAGGKACSHISLKHAMDIGVNGMTVVAVHSGVVTVGDSPCVGKYVEITSTCGSTAFSSLYGHLGAISVTSGQTVSVGQALGINDNTGSCTTGSHLHFEFQTSGDIPTVQTPYLVRDIPILCCDRTTCNP